MMAGARGLCLPGLFALLPVFAVAPHVAAQSSLTMDLSGAHVRYADSLSTSALSLSPSFRHDAAWTSARLAGTVSRLGTGSWTLHGAINGSLYSPAIGPFMGELGAAGGGSSHEDGARTGQGTALARAHLLARYGGFWLGLGAGSTWDGFEWRSIRQGEAGAWARIANAALVLGVTPTRVADSIRYVDTQLSVRWQQTRLDLGLSAGLRSGDRLPVLGGTAKSWGSVSLLAWLTRQVGLTASAGTYPVDFTQGFPGGRYATLGMRVRWPPPRISAQAPSFSGDNGSAAAANSLLAFAATPATGGHVLRVRAPAARKVEIAGDFTDWQPLALAPAEDGWWTLTLSISAGVHQLNVRIDGAAWLVPPGLTVVRDEFGGSVGLLIVRQEL
jgi:hypothetical protein